jgi:glycosidase
MKANHLFRMILLLTLGSVLITSCQPRTPAWTDVKSTMWWKDAVFYQVFVRSFADSNGDGIGDFKGLTAKLDYLNDGDSETDSDLGINGIWLMPIHPSPSYHGYDVTDYLAVNPQYGSLDDFKELLTEAHKRDIRVIIDFVINHTSNQHPWFEASAKGEDLFRDWYIWSEDNPGYRGPWGQQVWHKSGEQYYYGVFVSEMPDLNFRNPEVVEEIEEIASFWLKDVGVDGFRVDGAKHIIEDGKIQENSTETHAYLKGFLSYQKSLAPESLMVGEVLSETRDISKYVNNGELDLAFNFPLASDFINAAQFRLARQASNALNQAEIAFTDGEYATILSNHDFPRVMTQLKNDVIKAKAAATFLLTAPGVPFLYYGEEIGMTGGKPDEDIRKPMQWTSGENAGFTTGNPWAPVNDDYIQKNVDLQAEDPESLLNHYRRLIAIRSGHYALRGGQFIQVTTDNPLLFATLRVTEQEAVLILVNLDDQPMVDPKLAWETSPLTGVYQPHLLLGAGEINPLEVTGQGRVQDYSPLPEIPPLAHLIIQFRP